MDCDGKGTRAGLGAPWVVESRALSGRVGEGDGEGCVTCCREGEWVGVRIISAGEVVYRCGCSGGMLARLLTCWVTVCSLNRCSCDDARTRGLWEGASIPTQGSTAARHADGRVVPHVLNCNAQYSDSAWPSPTHASCSRAE